MVASMRSCLRASAIQLLILLLSWSPSAVFAVPVVHSCNEKVTYVGFITNLGVESFLNIPFGQDTGGPNRFKHPKPWIPPKNALTINATAVGPACPQPNPSSTMFSNLTNMSEDCLNLRITRPIGTTAWDKLPVMVYIYGGGYSFGQIYDQDYSPDGLVLESQKVGNPIIYVAMNYRTTYFGFAASTELAGEGSLNSGLLDQRLALQWVQENIADFGGDPNLVTIFGESAGGSSVGLQVTAFGGRQLRPPFHLAIMESGSPFLLVTDTPVADLEPHFNIIAAAVNCSPNSSTPAEVLQCVRQVPTGVLNAVVVAYDYETSPPFGFATFIPVVDGDFIPLPTFELLANGAFSRQVSAILGWNEDDGSIFTPLTLNSTAAIAEFLKEQHPLLTNASIATLLALYPESAFASPFDRASRLTRDIEFACPAVYFARQLTLFGEPDTHLYLLNQTALNAFIPFAIFGVSHFADVFYVFNDVSMISNSSADLQLANQMSGAWSRFAATGNPGVSWPTTFGTVGDATTYAGKLFVFGGVEPGARSIAATEDLGARCEFIVSITAQLSI